MIAFATVVFATLASFAERRLEPVGAATRALQGPLFGLAIPLAMLSLVSLAFAHGRVDISMQPVAVLGASRRSALLGALPGIAIVGAFLAWISAGLGTMTAHGFRTPGAPGDAWTTAYVAALTALAYVAYFTAASTFGAKGGGRLIALVADLLLGSVAGYAAIPFPRAHALNLLVAKLAPLQGKLGLVAIGVGIWMIISSVLWRI